MRKKRLVTGITPSGSLTIGNYFGILKRLKTYLDDGYELFVFVADVHAISIPQNVSNFDIRKNTLELLIVLNSLGISNNCENCNVFIQSQHNNLKLGFITQFFTSIGELERMTQFKSKKQGVTTSNKTVQIPTGLLTYPSLMAADILLFRPDVVPVGLDQKQHLELTKIIASRINKRMKEDFLTIPKFSAPKVGAKIKSLVDPEKKMSKSDKNANASLYLFDSDKDTKAKLKKSKTDSLNIITKKYKVDQPGVTNLLDLFYLTNENRDQLLDQFILKVNSSSAPYKTLKEGVITSLEKEFVIMRESISKLMKCEISLAMVENKLNENINWVPDFMKSTQWVKKQEFIRNESEQILNTILNKLGFII